MDISEEKLNKRFDKIESMIESLAASTAKGFEGVDKRLEDVYTRFDEIDKKFDQIDERFVGLESNLRMEIQRAKLEILDKTVSNARFSELENRVSDIESLLSSAKLKSI